MGQIGSPKQSSKFSIFGLYFDFQITLFTKSIAMEICETLIEAATSNYDRYMDNAKRKIVNFCEKNSLDDCLAIIELNRSLFSSQSNESDDYVIDPD